MLRLVVRPVLKPFRRTTSFVSENLHHKCGRWVVRCVCFSTQKRKEKKMVMQPKRNNDRQCFVCDWQSVNVNKNKVVESKIRSPHIFLVYISHMHIDVSHIGQSYPKTARIVHPPGNALEPHIIGFELGWSGWRQAQSGPWPVFAKENRPQTYGHST